MGHRDYNKNRCLFLSTLNVLVHLIPCQWNIDMDTLLVENIIGSYTRLRLIEIQTALSYWKI